MVKLCLFFILAIASYEALGMSTRHKRQNDQFGNETRRQQLFNIWSQQRRTAATRTTTTTTSTPAPLIEEVTLSDEVRACVRTCGVTSEYNPVCGTNDKTYDNPSRLYCDQACGVNVTHQRYGKCPPKI